MNDKPEDIQQDTVSKPKEYLIPAVTMYYQEPVALDHGQGMHVWDEKGNKYLDCFGGVLTTSVGHVHPHVTEAIIDQIKKISHTSTLYANRPQVELAQKLAEITPAK